MKHSLIPNHPSLSPWLDELPYEWSALEQAGTEVALQKNEIIFHYDHPVEYVYLVKKGRVRLFLTSALGDEKAVAIIGQNGLLGEGSVYQSYTYIASAITASPSVVVKLNPDDFQRLIMENKAYIKQLLEMMSLKIRLLSQHSLQLAFGTSFQRVCEMFVQLGLTYGDKQKSRNRINITIPFTHQEVANLVGATRVTVANHIKRLLDTKILSKSGKYYCIEDMSKLVEQLNSP